MGVVSPTPLPAAILKKARGGKQVDAGAKDAMRKPARELIVRLVTAWGEAERTAARTGSRVARGEPENAGGQDAARDS
jgi:hypothetical protein